MWRNRTAGLLTALLVAGLVIGAAAGRATGQENPLPPGEHMQLVLGACIICHAPEMVAQQRLDRLTWEAIVDRMITYGAPITPETKPMILNYLATHLRP